MKNVGKTVRGVRIGCHAFKRCCLNAVLAGRRDFTAGVSVAVDSAAEGISNFRVTARWSSVKQSRTCR